MPLIRRIIVRRTPPPPGRIIVVPRSWIGPPPGNNANKVCFWLGLGLLVLAFFGCFRGRTSDPVKPNGTAPVNVNVWKTAK